MNARICRICDGPRSMMAGGCTNGLCAECHVRFCTYGGVTSPGHGVDVAKARATLSNTDGIERSAQTSKEQEDKA